MSISAYIQDRVEYEGMFLSAGLRLDHFDPRSNVYEPDNPYTGIWNKDMSWPQSVDHYQRHWLDTVRVSLIGTSREFEIREAGSRTKLSPRLAISHPLSQDSKVYFNYGHFCTFPPTAHVFGGDVSRIPAPELDFPRTIMYELAVERQLTNGVYSWLFGWRTEPQYLLRIAGYYKDVTRTVDYVSYETTAGVRVRNRVATNKGYEQVRGFELRVQKRIGRFFTGWFQGEMSLRDHGNVGFKDVDILGNDDERESQYQMTSQAEPAWSWYANLHTPRGFSPFGITPAIAEQWALIVNASYSQGRLQTYNPAGDSPPPPLNVRVRDTWTSSLALEKALSYGHARATVSLTVSNIFGYKSVSQFGMTRTEWEGYLKSLHFPIRDVTIETWRDENGNPGNDRIGDYPDYAVLPDHDEWALFLNPRMYTLAFRVSF